MQNKENKTDPAPVEKEIAVTIIIYDSAISSLDLSRPWNVSFIEAGTSRRDLDPGLTCDLYAWLTCGLDPGLTCDFYLLTDLWDWSWTDVWPLRTLDWPEPFAIAWPVTFTFDWSVIFTFNWPVTLLTGLWPSPLTDLWRFWLLRSSLAGASSRGGHELGVDLVMLLEGLHGQLVVAAGHPAVLRPPAAVKARRLADCCCHDHSTPTEGQL